MVTATGLIRILRTPRQAQRLGENGESPRFFINLFVALIVLLLMSCSPVMDGKEREPLVESSPTLQPSLTATPSIPTTPTALPTPALDAGWDALPLPSAPPTLVDTAHTFTKTSADPLTFPSVAPSGRVLEAPGAVWGAGFRNGLPGVADSEPPEGEYNPSRSFASVIHMHDPSEFPPFLEPGQSVVIHLPAFPPDVYALHVYTTGDNLDGDRISPFPNRSLALERNLSIRWNDRRVWQRFHAPFADEIRVVLDPALLKPDGNLIVLENRGEHIVPLDAVRVYSMRPGSAPFYVAFEDAEWLPSESSPWVRTVRVRLPAPFLSGEVPKKWDFPVRKAPRDSEDAQFAWSQVEARYRELEAMNHPHLEFLRQWIAPLRDAVQRGMIPLILLEGDTAYTQDLRAAAFLFGDVVGGWTLRQPGNRSNIRSQLKTFIDSPVFLDGHTEETPDLPRTGSIETSFHHLLLPYLGMQLRRFFNDEISLERLKGFKDRSYTLYPDQDEHFKERRQGPMGEWMFRNAVELLATSRRGVTLSRGFPCGPFFPDGSGRPSSVWGYVRPLFRFGGVSSFESMANIVPEQSGTLLNSAFWAVADNKRDRVEVLASVPYAEGQMMTLDLPLPWSGPTRVLQHTVSPNWKGTGSPETKTTVRIVEASEILQPGTSSFRGWMRYSFSAQHLHLFELSPADAPPKTSRRSVNSSGQPHVPKIDTLFRLSELPPPAWWSRERLDQNKRWAWREAGPIDLETESPTRPGRLPAWEPLQAFHPPFFMNVEGATPLSDTSTTFRFLKNPDKKPQVLRMEMAFSIIDRTEAVGMWVRAHPAPGAVLRPDGFHNRRRTRFWVGNRQGRQLIELPYGSWCFLSGSASFWRTEKPTGEPVQRTGVLFWPDESLEYQPILEVNSFDAYKVSLKRGLESPDQTLGFVHEREDGTLALLVVGVPAKGGFWRQRFDQYVDSGSFVHVEDETLRISAPSPEDPPPEKVKYSIQGEPNAKLVEIHIPRMPGPPSAWYRERILKEFPLIGDLLANEGLSAVLFTEVREPFGSKESSQ